MTQNVKSDHGCKGRYGPECLPARKSVSETVFALRKLPPPRDFMFVSHSSDCRILPRSTRSLPFHRIVADFDSPSAKNFGRRSPVVEMF